MQVHDEFIWDLLDQEGSPVSDPARGLLVRSRWKGEFVGIVLEVLEPKEKVRVVWAGGTPHVVRPRNDGDLTL